MNIKSGLLAIIFGFSLIVNTINASSLSNQQIISRMGLLAGFAISVEGILFGYGAKKHIKHLNQKDMNNSKVKRIIADAKKEYKLSVAAIILGLSVMGISWKYLK